MKNEPIVISDAKISVTNGWRELSACLDGDRLWFRVPKDIPLVLRAEPFVAAGLLEAMFRKSNIEVESGIPLSPRVNNNIAELQAIFHCWNETLECIDVNAELRCPSETNNWVGSCYSGGVDSSHTLLKYKKEISHLILILGFEPGSDDDWDMRIDRHDRFARSLGKVLLPVQTNARTFSRARGISWTCGHGLCLSSLGAALNVSRMYIPSSHTYDELFPWGSHPLSDPLWSTEVTEVVHACAGFRRSEKMRELCTAQEFLNNLQVCQRSTNRNCGECVKCVRTMLALLLLGAHSKTLPSIHSKNQIRQLKAHDESGLTYLDDAILLARESGNKSIYKRLRRYQTRYELRRFISIADRTLLNNMLRTLYRRARKSNRLSDRVTLRPIK